MAIKYKIDIMDALKRAGYTTYRLRVDKLLGECAMTSLRNERPVSMDTLDKLCGLLNCQPGDLLMYVDEQAKKKK